jgi:exopolysaccharide production protein ExoQ
VTTRVVLGSFGLAAALGVSAVRGVTDAFVVVGVVTAVTWGATLDGWQRLYAIMLLFMIGAESSVPIFAEDSNRLRYVVAALLMLWTWRKRAHSQVPRVARRLVGVLTVLVILAFASTAWSVDRAVTFQQSFALLFVSGLVALLARDRWADGKLIGEDLGVAFTMLTASAVVSLGLVAVHDPGARAFNLRLQGIYNNPNALGYLTAIGIPLGVACYLSTRRPWYLVGIVPLAVALVQCQSRTALVAVVVGVLWLVARRGVGAFAKATVAVGALFAVLIVGAPVFAFHTPSFISTTEARFENGGGTGLLNSRTIAWSDAVGLWKQQPIEGYGFQAGEALFDEDFDNGKINFAAVVVHNSYLQVLLELGLLGVLVLLAAIIGVFVPVMFRAAREHPGSPFVGVVVTGLAVQITESAMFGTGQPYPWVFWLAACAAAMAVPDRQAVREQVIAPGRALVAV